MLSEGGLLSPSNLGGYWKSCDVGFLGIGGIILSSSGKGISLGLKGPPE